MPLAVVTYTANSELLGIEFPQLRENVPVKRLGKLRMRQSEQQRIITARSDAELNSLVMNFRAPHFERGQAPCA